MRELLRVALPLVLSSGSLSLMNVIDRIFLTAYSTDALAASTPAGLLHWTAMSLVIGTAGCVTTLVAQYEGAGRKNRVASAVWQGVWLSLTAGIIFLAIVPLSPMIFRWAGHSAPVQRLEVEYFSVLCYGAVPMTLCSALSGFYSGRGRTLTVMWVNVGLAVANIVLDYLLIFGKGPFPAMGMRGAALATVIAYVGAAVAYFLLLGRKLERTEYGVWASWRFDRELFGRLLRFGLPTGGQFLIDIAGFTIFLCLVGRLGPLCQKATNLAFNLNGLSFVPLMGLGTAVMAIVGRRMGEGRPELASRTVWSAFLLGGGWMIVFGLVYTLLPDMILAPYAVGASPAEFAEIRETAVVLLRYVAFFAFFDAMVVIFSSAVRGAGDTRFPMLVMLGTSWGMMLAPVAVAEWYGVNSLHFSWIMCTLAIMTSGMVMCSRFLQGRWKTIKVIEAEASSEKPPADGSAKKPLRNVVRPRQGQPALEAAAV
ncbi:MAG: MATE family efflux transporter [Planctomycetota bacterium]|nr:MATE family efflux transporter [Planctomycetaceae bacterium]MDQ3329477.1 MATE family efflux transporter [Planctomycetota bacterium]